MSANKMERICAVCGDRYGDHGGTVTNRQGAPCPNPAWSGTGSGRFLTDQFFTPMPKDMSRPMYPSDLGMFETSDHLFHELEPYQTFVSLGKAYFRRKTEEKAFRSKATFELAKSIFLYDTEKYINFRGQTCLTTCWKDYWKASLARLGLTHEDVDYQHLSSPYLIERKGNPL